jgi:predicted lipid-binding transport protein (Tim44 family)
MKLSWTSFKISVAGARLSHLVQKDKIWDHGTMVEQVRNIFYKIEKAKASGHIEELKRFITPRCYERLKKEFDDLGRKGKKWIVKNAMIKEIAVIEVAKGNERRPDCFTALIKAMGIQFIADTKATNEMVDYSNHVRNFSEQWSFIRQGDWWALNEMK